MRRAAIGFLMVSALAWGQQAAKLPTLEELQFPPLKQVELPEVETFTLPNGMKVYLLEDHELPLVGGFALVRTGNLFDPPDKVGLASITGEVMRTGGTKEKTGDEIDEELENIAASVESSIGETSGTVGFNCLKENTDEVLAVFKAILTAPEFRQEKIDLAKTQYRSMISRRNDEPGGIARREFSEILYGRDTPYGWRMEYEHLDNIEREDLIAFHRRYYFPKNVMLAIQGDFDTAEMKAKLEKLFADWTVEQPPVPEFPKVTAKPAPGVYLAVKEDVNQTFLRMGHLDGMLKDPDYPALEVMADILGGGFSSRLFKKIRTELGYAYGIGAFWGANYNHPGIFGIGGSTKSGSTVATIRATLEEVKKIRSEEVAPEELKTAKDKVLNSFVFNFDSPGKTLRRLVRYDYYGYPKDFIFRYQKAVAAVTVADVLRVAKQYIKPEEFTIVTVGNPKEFDEPLESLGLPVKEIDLTIPEPKREKAETSAASLARGKELLGKLQAAVGGAAKLVGVKDATRVTQVTIQTPQGGMQVNQVNQWLAPAYFRQEQVLPFGKITVFFDGKAGWLAGPQGTQPMPPPVVRQVRNALLRNPFRLWLADRQEGWTVNAVDERTLEVSDETGESLRLEIDPETGMPVKQTYRSVAMTGAPSEMVETFSDWREVDGIRLPFRAETTRDGKPYAELVVKEIRLNTGLEPAELAKKP